MHQVLSKALEVWALQLVNLQSPDAAQAASAPHLEEAFICNLDVSTTAAYPTLDVLRHSASSATPSDGDDRC